MSEYKIQLISNRGSGVPETVECETGESLQSLVNKQKGIGTENQVLVNGEKKPMTYALKDGDRVSITPTNIKGGL